MTVTNPANGQGEIARRQSRMIRVEVAGDGVITAVNARGGQLRVGTGWEGEDFNPIELLLAAIGGCAAIDFSAVLEKRRHSLSSLSIEVSGHKAEDERLEEIAVHYLLPEGEMVRREEVEVARRLTAEVLCTVSRTVEIGCPVDHLVRANSARDVRVAPTPGFEPLDEAAVDDGVSCNEEKEESDDAKR
jgi:uncharacterized OsmC-like protein